MFDDISLLDDPLPQLDLSFGGTDDKDKGSTVGFGGWGSSWNTGNKWDFSGADATGADVTGGTAIKDTKATTGDAGESNVWSFGSNKKSKKKTTTSGFDFTDFGLDEMKEEEPAAEENKTREETDRGGFMFVGKKDKKKGKKGTGEEAIKGPEPVAIDVPLPDPVGAGDSSWGGWGATSSKKDAKKGKKVVNEVDSPLDDLPAPPPAAPVETAGDDAWETFASKKDKKKGKKSAIEEPTVTEGPAAVVMPDPEPMVDEGWGAISTKKDKKKGKKGIVEEVTKPEEAPVVSIPESEPVEDDTWGGSTTKKDKKKGKKGTAEEIPKPEEAAVVSVPEPEPFEDDTWGFTTKNQKKKGKKGAAEELAKPEEAAIVSVPEPEPIADDTWGAFTTKKDKKKGKKGAFEDPPPPPLEDQPAVVAVPEFPPADEGWGSVGTKKDKKKGKKGASEDPLPPPPEDQPAVVAVPEPPPADEGFGPVGTKKDKKKGKKGAFEDPLPRSPDEQHSVVAVSEFPPADEGWGTFENKKDKKKGKKSAVEEHAHVEEPVIAVIPESEPAAEEDWGMFGPKRDKKKGKKSAFEDLPQADDHAESIVPAVEPAAEATWGTIGGTAVKNNKKGKKNSITEVKEAPIAVVESASIPEAADTVADDDRTGWAGASKKKEKKGRKGSMVGSKADEAFPPPPPPPPPAEFPDVQDTFKTDDWDPWGTSKKDKDKKGNKGKVAEPDPPIGAVPEPDTFKTDDWDPWSTSKKDKDKKGKKGKVAEPDPPIGAVPEPVTETKAGPEDEWGTLGLSSKDKKRREKEKEKAGKKGGAAEVVDEFDFEGLMANTLPESAPPVEEETWGTRRTSKTDKKIGGKKVKGFEVPPPAPDPPVIPGLDDPEEDDWGSFAPVKSKDKKDAKADTLAGMSFMSKTTKIEESKVGKKSPKAKNDDLIATVSELPKDKASTESKKDVKEDDTPAKAAKSFWGGFGSTPATKIKPRKDKDDVEADPVDDDDSTGEEDENAIVEIIAEPPKKSAKGAKGKADSKLTKTNSKESDKGGKADDKKKKGDTSALIDIVEEAGKDTDGSVWKSMDAEDKQEAKEGKKDEKRDDPWSFWGPKKTTGKKADESKKEITKPDWANQKASLAKASNAPEVTLADEAPPPLKTTMATMKASDTKSKVAGKLSVAEKVKALEREKEKKLEATLLPAPEPKPLPKADPPPEKASASTKSKGATANKSASSKKKDLSPPADHSKTSNDSVPGSFPSEAADDDIMDVVDLYPVDSKPSKKNAKSKKEPIMADMKESTMADMEEPTMADMEEPTMADMLVEAPPPPAPLAPPTPPPEPVSSKPVKKERARVVRDDGAGSWGFWGSPKKDVKKERKPKDVADIAPPTPKEKVSPPGLTRSKSTKTPKEKEREVEKSSGSEKGKKAVPKPAKARGMGFVGMFGASPAPPKTKSTGRPSTAIPKSTSRRESVDVGAVGNPSPPPDDLPEMNGKAAKVMGMRSGKLGRKESTRGKQKASGKTCMTLLTLSLRPANFPDAVVPDPYAIDDDDIVLVNDLQDPVINATSALKESGKAVGLDRGSKSKPNRKGSATPKIPPEVVTDAQALPEENLPTWEPDFEPFVEADDKTEYKQSKSRSDPADDIVMVEAGPSTDGPDVVTGPEDLNFVEKPREPPRLKRSAATNTKNPAKLMGLFGSFRNTRRVSEAYVLPKNKGAYGDDGGNERRKRTVSGGGDDVKRLRRDKRDVRRADTRDFDGDGFVTDAAPNGGASTEAEDAEARREERRAKRALRDQEAKEAREADVRAAEDRRARRREAEQAQAEADRAKRRDARARKAKEEGDREARRQADKRTRRTARDEMNARIEASRDGETRGSDRRSRRRDDDPLAEPSTRPHRSDRRRSHVDKTNSIRSPDDEIERRHRRTRRTPTKETSRRKSAAPVDDYFDPRNGADALNPEPLPAQDPPYIPHDNGTNDHTSSWVNSQIIEPPAPPPIEPSVIEPTPTANGDDAGVKDGDSVVEETARRAPRHSSQRQSRYADMGADEVDERRRRRESRRADREAVRSSEGSGDGDRYARRKSQYSGGYAEKIGGVRTFDGRAANGAGVKRASWFKKITNLQM